MFDEMVVSSPNPTKTNKPWTVILSMVFQTAFLAVLILIPLIYTEALPKTMMATVAPRRFIFFALQASSITYMQPRAVASPRPSEPPSEIGFPVTTPGAASPPTIA